MAFRFAHDRSAERLRQPVFSGSRMRIFARDGGAVAIYFFRIREGLCMFVRKVLVTSVFVAAISVTAQAQERQRPKINLLSIEQELMNCISGQIQTKIDEIAPVHDLSRSIKEPHLELVIGCEAISVEIRDKNGNLTPVPISTCASVLSENPGATIAKRAKIDTTNITRRLQIISTAGRMGQHCRVIFNKSVGRIYQWLGQGPSFK